MPDRPLRLGALTGTRGQIIDLLRRGPTTVREVAAQLDLTYQAVRPHLTALERDGLIRSTGVRRGGTRPAAVYELAPGVDAALSRAYVPFASHLVRMLGERLPQSELDELMREVGRRLATELPRKQGEPVERIEAAAALLQELGAPNEVEIDDGIARIRGYGCLLAEAIHGRAEICHAMESLVQELVGAPVRECCDRGARPRCCFEITLPPPA